MALTPTAIAVFDAPAPTDMLSAQALREPGLAE
jgi:hypothetical protein